MSEHQCKGTTKSNHSCKNSAGASGYCHLHNQSHQSDPVSIENNISWWQKTGFLQGMGAGIIAGVIAIFVAFTPNKIQPIVPQIKGGDDSSIHTGNGDIIHQSYDGLSQSQYNRLLKKLNGNNRLLNSLLDQLDIKNSTIFELTADIKKAQQRITKLLADTSISPEVKALVQAGELDEAERLVDVHYAEQVKNDEIKLAAKLYERANIKELKLKYVEAKVNFDKAAALQPNNATYQNRAGLINSALGNYDKAINYLELALKSDLKTFGENHPTVATSHNNLGAAWKAKGEYDKAINYYELALKSGLKTFGENHPTVAISHNNLGTAWEAKGEYDKAINYLELALKNFTKLFGENHQNTKIVKGNLTQVKVEMTKIKHKQRILE
ncbi:tetratricopeptide repeat protein (plasmid) [Psychrobium sp. nBUS_13]|uniref:tetratricopeptide repeat protein n=1 Tax=Psychrobium sp. nBUS_13 TaxID=3395319 RepID=UPI003EBF3C54